MKKFDGFPPGKLNTVMIPALFFTDVLPLIDDLAELKLTLYCFRALHQIEGEYRYLRRVDFVRDVALMDALAAIESDDAADTEALLDAAIARAVERGTLLHAEVALDSGAEQLYFLNTVRGRSAISQIQAGHWKSVAGERPIDILPERPNIYRLYENNIGMLTPMISDALKDAERTYPATWIEEAVEIAVKANKRSWRYIEAILKRWETEGKNRGIDGGHSEQNGERYVSGKYADFIES
ncbi:MAG: DnaD domain protein [Chloroflexi bacterium]|nr:MAG: primosomal replication protein N [Phototrophicales bacterium]RMF81377.1 MAG: DnaD domain protein [Chloroflexota bacterium]